MYQFSAITTNDYTIEIVSNTYWSCKAEGNFKLSQYNGSGNTKINIEIPSDVLTAEGYVYFSYGDERCKYPVLSINLSNLCYISTNPNYNVCVDGKNTIFFIYENPGEIFTVSIFCYDNWTFAATSVNGCISNNNELMIIAGEKDGQVQITPQHQCDGKNIVYIKLLKKADS